MAKKNSKYELSSDYLVIYSSSVEGGYSWALTNTDDRALIKSVCRKIACEVGGTFHLCSLGELVSAKSGNRTINSHWREFVASVINDEYDQFEDLNAKQLCADYLLDAHNRSLLHDLLQEFFDTGYKSCFDRFFLESDVNVVIQSEG